VAAARRWFFLTTGSISAGLGIVGLFLPLLPTVPFLLVAVWAFARSSPRLERWVVDHPTLGPPVRRWREHGVVSLRAKVLATVWLAISSAIAWTLAGPTAGGVATASCALVALFLWTRPSSAPGGDDEAPAEARPDERDAGAAR
jgi:uncharacterized membrane protein YbaN (DUF454 family)